MEDLFLLIVVVFVIGIFIYWILWALFNITCNKCHTQIWPSKKCPHCGDDPRAEYKNCNYCNKRIRATEYVKCSCCGHDPDARYVICSNCEHKTEYSNQICPFCNENPHEFRPFTRMFNIGKNIVKDIINSAPQVGRDLKRGVQITGSRMIYDFFKNL